MLIRFIYILSSLLIIPALQAKDLATISYKGKKGPVTIKISLEEFTKTWRNLKQVAPNTPSAKKFYDEYLRYRIGVEEAYNDSSLVRSPNIRNMFVDPMLKKHFDEIIYKHLAEKKLKAKISRIDKMSQKLSKKVMLKYYKNNPEFEANFIVISMPIDPNPKQIKEAQTRALKIYNDVKNSKKNFLELIDIYSDDRISGKISLPRNRHNIYPNIYKVLKKMKSGQISSPIRAANGFYIVKLLRRVPFGKANRTQIKATYFDLKRAQALKQYFNKIKTKYKIKTNTALLNSIR